MQIKEVILWVCLLITSSMGCNGQGMQAIQFIPKEFQTVKLGYYEHTPHALIPYYPETDGVMKNEIAINAPHKIIFKPKSDDFTPIIPVCGYAVITRRRGLKYADYDEVLGEYADHNTFKIHIKKATEEEWFNGEIIDDSGEIYEEDPDAEKYAEERLKEIKEAQKYTLEDLEDGQAGAGAFNVNVLRYVTIPLTSGIYEIYISALGLESNHVQVEIAIEK